MSAITRPHGPQPPHRVGLPVMLHRWDQLTFLHWSYDTETVQRLLPEGLEVEPYEGRAWVGLVPFRMRVRLPGLPHIPWLFDFPETNVRTYVIGPGGEPGVWFFSLDASRILPVATARATYRLPYFWSSMSVSRDQRVMRYRSRRRWPHPGATSDVEVAIDEAYPPSALTEFDHYLTARFVLYSRWGGRLVLARAEHPPWSLHRARLRVCDDQLVTAAGLPAPEGAPLLHWSPGVDVRIGLPERAG